MSGFKIDVKNENDKYINIIRMIAIYISLLLVYNAYFSAFKIKGGFFKPALILVLIVVFCYMMMYIPKYRAIRNIIFFVIFAAILWINAETIAKGMEIFINSFNKLNSSYALYKTIEETSVNGEFFFTLAVSMVVCALIFSTSVFVKPFRILSIIIILVPFILSSIVGYIPSTANVCKLLIAGILCMSCYRNYNGREYIISTVGMVIIMALILAVSAANVSKVEKYKKDNSVKYKEVREELKMLNEFSISELIKKQIENRGNYTKGGVGKGNLKNLSNCKPEGTEELEVTVSNDDVTVSTKPVSRVYLKAFVGTTYTGDAWEELGTEAIDKLKEFADDEESRAELLNITFDKIKAIDDENTKANNENEYALIVNLSYMNYWMQNMNIRILNDSTDVGYFPYNSKVTDTKGVNFDSYIDGEGRESYTYKFYEQDTVINLLNNFSYYYGEDLELLSAKARDIFVSQSELWEKYSEFVSEEYIEYPENLTELSKICDEFVHTNTMTDVEEEINERFMTKLNYTLNPGKKPEDKDFVEYFLQNEKGFCVHFATTAALIYRKFGYPSRYVEGYAIPPSAFVKQSDGSYKAVVTDEMAHAWCETFDENLGWIPKEHTLYYQNLDNFYAGDFKEPSTQANIETTTQPVTENEIETKKEETTTNVETETTEKSISNIGGATAGRVKNSNVLNKIIYFVIIMLILVILCLVQCGVRINNKMRKFRSKKGNTAILCIYNEIYELCCFCGMKLEERAENEIFKYMRQNYNQLSDDEWLWIYECVVRSAFSNKTPNKNDRRMMYQLMLKLKKQVWNDLSIQRKFVFKFIKAM